VINDFVGAGWSYPLELDAGGGFALAGGARKLEQSIRLILTTYPGERPMRPEFGSLLRDFVFRPSSLDNSAELSYEVRRSLERWEPRIAVERVDTHPSWRDGVLDIGIHYTVLATNDRRNLVVPFYSIPQHEGER